MRVQTSGLAEVIMSETELDGESWQRDQGEQIVKTTVSVLDSLPPPTLARAYVHMLPELPP